ncbi:uncharacterized protein LOC110449748 [Mizuhopecten yessoensis]|uniref:Uncharacterized protein n=1 Tax=Mizuhopecten yessoensis TaxID=6573 RepID=A0A210QQI7_MIZYE|nr:uncharacterized protein LOC110449748 [Mizuhopecten yessoensis]XP_021352481.1 uncharacterized protein LOC110449748 [Mizuhopecten yessoensis]OWF51006.1 hypothetical protein KP79_PYT10016 [Mizuhopecten yessoensis]
MRTRSSTREESSLPSIFRSGPLNSTSTDDSESSTESKPDKEIDFPRDTSTSESVFKLPTIDGSRTNSVTSFMTTPNSNSNPRRRQSRDRSRRRLCKSPSCPSNIGFSGQQSVELESPTDTDKTSLNVSPGNEDNEFKLPNIYRNSNSLSLPTSSQSEKLNPWHSARDIDQTSRRSLRRTESCRDAYNIGSPVMETKVKNHQRSQTHAALLLPIRNSETRVSLKGKKKKNTQVSPRTYQDFSAHIQTELNNGAQNGWESEYDSDLYDSARGTGGNTFDRIIEETDGHVDIPSSRNIKPWLKDRQKEGQVKA